MTSIARNITYVLEKLNGAPVLALYSGVHTKKRELSGDRYPYSVESRVPWVQQLLNKEISIYSTFTRDCKEKDGILVVFQ